MDPVYTTDIQIRYQDIDRLAHVSYPVFVTYMQQVRLDYARDVLDMDPDDRDMVVVHLEVDYEQEITVEKPVTVDMAIPRIGETSFTAEYMVRTATEVAATGETVQVVIDTGSGDPVRVPASWREQMQP